MKGFVTVVMLAGSVALGGCVPVVTLPLTRPAVGSSGGLRIESPAVAASPNFLAQRGGAWSVLGATLVVTNTTADRFVLDIDRATLVISDPGSELPEIVLPATASGTGPVPPAIPLDSAPIAITAGAGSYSVLWVAFRAREALEEPGLRRRIVVRIPVSGGGPPIDVVIAEPGAPQTRWALSPVAHASYFGVSAAGTSDEGSVGFLRTSPKTVFGPIMVAPAIELGARAGKLRGESEAKIVCCDLGLSLDLAALLLRGSWGSLGPTLGYHAIFALESGRADRATWHGPSIGLTFFAPPIEPRIAGALPVRTEPSRLGYSSFAVQYVHWFRRGDEGGSPGALFTLERSIPEW